MYTVVAAAVQFSQILFKKSLWMHLYLFWKVLPLLLLLQLHLLSPLLILLLLLPLLLCLRSPICILISAHLHRQPKAFLKGSRPILTKWVLSKQVRLASTNSPLSRSSKFKPKSISNNNNSSWQLQSKPKADRSPHLALNQSQWNKSEL